MIDAINEELEIRQMFLEEAQEYVDTMDDGLVGIDPQSSTFKQQMDAVLRSAHSLKGAAGIMQFHELSATAHRLEDSLKIIKSNQPDIDISIERLLLNAVGLLREIIAINRQGKDVDRRWLESYDLAVFIPLETYLNEAESHATEDIPEPELDIAALMFEQEINEMLDNLEAKLNTSFDISTLKTELQTLASELADLGEMLELPNFVELNQAIAQQIEVVSPDRINELAIAASIEWRRSQALVIEGCKSDIPSEFNFNQQDNQQDIDAPIAENYEDSTEFISTDEIVSVNSDSLDNLTEPTIGDRNLNQYISVDDELGLDDLLSLDRIEDYEVTHEEVNANSQQPPITTELELDDLLVLNIENLDIENSNISENISEDYEEEFLSPDRDLEIEDLFSLDDSSEDNFIEIDQNYEQIESLNIELELEELFGDRELTSQFTAEPLFIDEENIDSLDDSIADNPFNEVTEIEDILNLNPFTDILDDEDLDIFNIDSNTELLFELPLIDEFEERAPLIADQVSGSEEVEGLFEDDSTELEIPLINELIDESLEAIALVTSEQESEQSVVNFDPIFNDFGQYSSQKGSDSNNLDRSPDKSIERISAVGNQDTIGDFFESFFNSTPPAPVTDIASKTSSKDTVNDLFDSFLEDSVAQDLSQWQQMDDLILPQAIAIEFPTERIDNLEVTSTDLFDGFWENSDSEIAQNYRQEPEVDTFNNRSEDIADDLFNSLEINDLGKNNLSQYVKKSTSAIAPILLPDTLEELQEDLETSGDLPESIPSQVSDLVTSYVKDTSIRLPISRLEQLHDLSGEMIFGHNSLDVQVKQLRQLLNSLNTRIRVLEDANSQISTVYDRMTIEASAKSGIIAAINSKQIGDFDVLELDTYSELHSLSQSISEAIVQLQEVVEDVDLSLYETEQNTNSLTSNFRQLQTAIKETKMRPLKDVVGRFPRVIRSLSLEYDKQVEVILNGADLLVEQTIIDVINDPLNHLLRNAFDHGIEDKETRIKRGKNPKGKITITATQKIEISQSPWLMTVGGIDPQKIKAKIARSPGDLGLTAAQVALMDNNQLIQLIFEPGFTTTDRVTNLSGRGVGMDVVRTNLKQIGAEIHTETELGVGTTFTIAIPFILSTLRIALIEINQTILGIPTDCIQAVIPDLNFTNDLSDRDAPVLYQDALIPVFPLSKHLQLNYPSSDRHLEDKPSAATKSILIIEREQVLWAIYVNGVWGEQEVTVRQPMGKIPMPKIFTGCAIAANGQSVPILDIQVLTKNPLRISSTATTTTSPKIQKTNQDFNQNGNPKIGQSTILVVDDSIAVRRYLALLLKKAGFKVEQAKDGEEAIAKLNTNSSGLLIDIVLSDVEMPRLDGYGLLTLIKSAPNLQHLPVVMLTSRSGDKHRELAVNLGAAQYFTKPFAEEELIQCLRDLASK